MKDLSSKTEAAIYSVTSCWLALIAAALVLATFSTAPRSLAQSAGEKTFASPGDAALALYTAAKAQDNQALASIFGSNAKSILHTGDDVADKNGGVIRARRVGAEGIEIVRPIGPAAERDPIRLPAK